MYLNQEQGNQLFVELLQEPMGEMGFVFEDKSIVRKKRFGKEKISYDQLDTLSGNRFYFEYSATKYINPIDDIWGEYWADLELVHGITIPPGTRPFTMSFNAKRISEYKFDPQNLRQWIRCDDAYFTEATVKGVHQLMDQFLQNFRLYVMPAFDRFNNILLLDAFINEKPHYYVEVIHIFTGVGLYFKKMIIAKLAGNKDYELVCDAVRQMINKHFKDNEKGVNTYNSICERVYEKLKNVSPLENPVLD